MTTQFLGASVIKSSCWAKRRGWNAGTTSPIWKRFWCLHDCDLRERRVHPVQGWTLKLRWSAAVVIAPAAQTRHCSPERLVCRLRLLRRGGAIPRDSPSQVPGDPPSTWLTPPFFPFQLSGETKGTQPSTDSAPVLPMRLAQKSATISCSGHLHFARNLAHRRTCF